MYKIPVSNGEIVDKFTILRIKLVKIKDTKKLSFIDKEFNLLSKYVNEIKKVSNIDNLINQLQKVNEKLWNLEDLIRNKEDEKQFDEEFINIARNIYKNNDTRCNIKLKINIITDSKLREIKSYQIK